MQADWQAPQLTSARSQVLMSFVVSCCLFLVQCKFYLHAFKFLLHDQSWDRACQYPLL
jgi:hypothetical protein